MTVEEVREIIHNRINDIDKLNPIVGIEWVGNEHEARKRELKLLLTLLEEY